MQIRRNDVEQGYNGLVALSYDDHPEVVKKTAFDQRLNWLVSQ